MNFRIDHNCLCGICKNECIDDYMHTAKEIGCESCGDIFFICGHCNGENCPKCGRKLKDKIDIYPYNFFNAIKKDDIDQIQTIMCNTNCNIEVEDEQGNIPIICAAVNQNFNICKVLIDNRASPRQQNKYGRTALIEMVHLRSSKWDNKVAELFSDSVNYKDNDGKTALMFAVKGAGLFGSKKGNIRIATQLINMGADTTLADNNGYTALWWALESNKKSKTSNNDEMVDFLTEQMINQVAVREFRKNYTYEFTDKKFLSSQKKQPS